VSTVVYEVSETMVKYHLHLCTMWNTVWGHSWGVANGA